ncbi:MAG: FGGY family carbohydrate kinase [Bacteroidia bacterium]|nr:FGGY family carbohydrate kinase [Bacteroidia bacterium]
MIAVLDIGKTLKKAFLFSASGRILHESQAQLPETQDEDGFPCEDLPLLRSWVLDTLSELAAQGGGDIRAVNAAAYGASLVYVDEQLQPVAPLYNYLKPYPAALQAQWLERHGSAEQLQLEMASPLMGSLNSGLQLWRIRQEQPAQDARMRYALHLPQYIASLVSGQAASELTSLGCHTMLWDFRAQAYHRWVRSEGLDAKLAPPADSGQALPVRWGRHAWLAGTGLHDSSSALIPYLMEFREPFVLLSTGTWSIALNPFNAEPLTAEELAQDCLCYLSYWGKPVKAARLLAGPPHAEAVRAIAAEHGVAEDFWLGAPPAAGRPALEAYAAWMEGFVALQAEALRLALGRTPVRRIFVDGGFSKNEWFMRGLARAFPDLEVYAARVAQATALGAALAMRDLWDAYPEQLVELRRMGPA